MKFKILQDSDQVGLNSRLNELLKGNDIIDIKLSTCLDSYSILIITMVVQYKPK